MRFLFVGLFSFLFILPARSGGTPVVLQTHLQPPYQIMDASQLIGSIPDILHCIFNELERPYAVTIAPRNRNRELVKANRIDGFFLSIPDDGLDQNSIPTEPLALERWKFFRLKSASLPDFPTEHVVGAVLGSNESVWLKQNGMPTSVTIPNTNSLLKLLHTGRIPFTLVDESTFETASTKNGISLDNMSSKFVRYVPLVAYFSKEFVSKNPRFIEKFNSSLGLCVKGIRTTRSVERKHLLDITNKILGKYKNLLIDEMINGQHQNQSFVQKHIADKKWKFAIKEETKTASIKQILSNKLSAILKKITEEEQSITEIFLTDKQGFNIGMNISTSDYWQGDELAFKALSIGQAHYVSKIIFDHSTRKFQIQVSMPIIADMTNQQLGMVTMAFDANKVFSSLGF